MDEMQNKGQLPINWGCLLSQLWLELEAWPICSLESTGMGVGGRGVDEIQNKAEAQPALMQLAAGVYLSLEQSNLKLSISYTDPLSFWLIPDKAEDPKVLQQVLY